MIKQKITFIINPFSGTSNKENIINLINNKLDLSKYDLNIKFTEHAGHGITIAREEVNAKTDVLVAVGGDGTVNEIGSVLKNTDSCLGIIPGGSGNGFFMHLGIGRNPKTAIDIINTGKQISVDTCLLNNHFFLNVAGLGFDARIAYFTKLNKKRGFFHYFKTSMKESKHFKPQFVELDLDGKKLSGKYTAVVAANASMYGYNFTVAPFAALDDGILDVMLIKEAPIYRYFISAYRFLNKTLHKSSLTESYKAKNIKMKATEPIYYHVDGEGFPEAVEFEVKIEPKSLKVLVPKQFPESIA